MQEDQNLLAKMQHVADWIETQGDSKMLAQRQDQGLMRIRTYLISMLDDNSFVETDAMMQNAQGPIGDGVITGFGTIHGRFVHVFAQDEAISKTLGIAQATKIQRIMQLALQNGTPLIGIFDGTSLDDGSCLPAYSLYADLLRLRTQLSGVIPQISVIFGSCKGASKLMPMLGDYVITIQNPNLHSHEETAAAENIDNALSASDKLDIYQTHVSVLTADSHAHAMQKVRDLLSYLPDNNADDPPYAIPKDSLNRSIEELDTLVCGEEYGDILEVLAALADDRIFFDLSSNPDSFIVTALCRIGGYVCGILATQGLMNQGILRDADAAKAARFIQTCDCFHMPVITLLDCAGFAMDNGDAQNSASFASLVYAMAQATCPKITVLLHKAHGSAYLCFASRGMVDMTFAWPSVRIASSTDNQDQSIDAWQAASLGMIDDIVAPHATRQRLIHSLQMLSGKRTMPAVGRKHGNQPQ